MNLIITRSDSWVECFLLQKPTVGEALAILQEDWRFAAARSLIWEISPGSDQANAPRGGMRLRELQSVGIHSVAQAKLNEALYYANQKPDDEVELITRFAAQLLKRIQELKAGSSHSIAQSAALIQNEVEVKKEG